MLQTKYSLKIKRGDKNMEMATKLVKRTFIESLHTHQELAKREFVELKKIDSNERNREKSKIKTESEKLKDEYIVSNYLWHYFPEAMAKAGYQDSQILRQEIGEPEFKKILKKAKIFRNIFITIPSITTTVVLTVLTIWTFALGSGFGFLSSIFAMISGIFTVLLSNPSPTYPTISKRESIIMFYQKAKRIPESK